MKVYAAGPFFTPDQVNTQQKVEEILTKYGYDFFSPRLEGGVFNKDAPEEVRQKQAQDIFDNNLNSMSSVDFAICNIDDRDTGTAWEFGWFNGKGKPAVTFSGHNYGCNIMLSQSGLGHCPNLEILDKFLGKLKELVDDTPDIIIEDAIKLAIKEAASNKGNADE